MVGNLGVEFSDILNPGKAGITVESIIIDRSGFGFVKVVV